MVMLFRLASQFDKSATKRIEGATRKVVCFTVVVDPLIGTGPTRNPSATREKGNELASGSRPNTGCSCVNIM